jgi:hypothetical protein
VLARQSLHITQTTHLRALALMVDRVLLVTRQAINPSPVTGINARIAVTLMVFCQLSRALLEKPRVACPSGIFQVGIPALECCKTHSITF